MCSTIMGKALPTLFIFHRWLPMLVIMMMIMGSAHAFSVCIMVSQGPRGGQTGTTLGGEGPYRVNVPPHPLETAAPAHG